MRGALAHVCFGPIADIQERAVQTERPPRAVSPKSDQVQFGAQLLVCLCATFEHADARLLLEAALPDFGGLYLCLIRQPSKQNLAFNLYVRFGSKADICAATGHVRFTPNIDCAFPQTVTALPPRADICG